MKLSFTTAGCPGWTFDEIFSTAKDLGMKGIEMRGVGNVVFAPGLSIFSASNLEATKKRFLEADMEIPVFDSDSAFGLDKVCADEALDEAKAYVKLAADMGTSYIRTLSTRAAAPEKFDYNRTLEYYGIICEYAKPLNVTPLMETNGAMSDTDIIGRLMEETVCENKGVLWDIHHPYRFFGEKPEETVKKLKKYIRHTHIKDSLINNDVLQYKMLGYGDIPVQEAVGALKSIGYEGYVSLEWLKRWNPELTEPGIVFAHFASFMEPLIEKNE